MTRKWEDDEAAAYYEADRQRLEPAGPPVRRTPSKLSGHFPVRFAPEVLAHIRLFADQDGVTVGEWVRRLVDREIDRRAPLIVKQAAATESNDLQGVVDLMAALRESIDSITEPVTPSAHLELVHDAGRKVS